MTTQSDAHKTAATPALLEAIRERAEFGPAHSHRSSPTAPPRLAAVGTGPSARQRAPQVVALALALTTVVAHEGQRRARAT